MAAPKPGRPEFDFAAQLRQGKKGEAFVERHWPHPIRRHEVLRGPDYVDSTGAIIEVKSDSYDMDKTANFFMERFSDGAKQTPGGPWQAMQKGVTCFVYLFLQNRTWFRFDDVPALCGRLEGLVLPLVGIPNRGYTTMGMKVPRESLKDLFTMEVFP